MVVNSVHGVLVSFQGREAHRAETFDSLVRCRPARPCSTSTKIIRACSAKSWCDSARALFALVTRLDLDNCAGTVVRSTRFFWGVLRNSKLCSC